MATFTTFTRQDKARETREDETTQGDASQEVIKSIRRYIAFPSFWKRQYKARQEKAKHVNIKTRQEDKTALHNTRKDKKTRQETRQETRQHNTTQHRKSHDWRLKDQIGTGTGTGAVTGTGTKDKGQGQKVKELK